MDLEKFDRMVKKVTNNSSFDDKEKKLEAVREMIKAMSPEERKQMIGRFTEKGGKVFSNGQLAETMADDPQLFKDIMEGYQLYRREFMK